MAEKDKKYYWLKLKRDFFKRHDIQIIEGMPNGKDYILFYLKLLCESVDHDGNLRFSDEIPYNEQMLATITNTNIDIVRSAVKLFVNLHMLEIMDDGTYYMNQVQKMIGSETYWAQKKREQKERKLLGSGESVGNFPTESNDFPTSPSKSIEKEIEKELDIEREQEVNTDSANPSTPPPPKSNKPVKHRKGEYQHVLLTDEQEEKLIDEYGEIVTVKAIEFLDEYIEMKGYKAKNHYLAIRKWVVDAVREQEQKGTRYGKPKTDTYKSFDGEVFFQQAVSRSKKTVAEDESLKSRVAALKEKLGQ